MKPVANSNPIHHTQKIKDRMRQLIEHLRADTAKINEPKAQALFETSAEVLIGLVKAFNDYEQKQEVAFHHRRLQSALGKPSAAPGLPQRDAGLIKHGGRRSLHLELGERAMRQ